MPSWPRRPKRSKAGSASTSTRPRRPPRPGCSWPPRLRSCRASGDTATRLLPDGQTCPDQGGEHRLLLRAEIPVHDASLAHSLVGRVEWQATLYNRTLVRRKPGQNDPPPERLSQSQRELWLAETPTLNFSSEVFQHWLRRQHLVRGAGDSDLDFARRAFLAIRHAYHYHYAEEMDRHATFVCQHDSADCGGMSILYVATLRANQVPARVLFGRWAKSAVAGATLEGALTTSSTSNPNSSPRTSAGCRPISPGR